MRLLLVVLYLINLGYVLATIRRQDQDAYRHEADFKEEMATHNQQHSSLADLVEIPPATA